MKPRIGSLCSGYGGLDMAVQAVFGGEIAWFFEYDKAPSKILAHHWPHIPNYGDMTKADWSAIEQVDILCGGTPCQDLSGAGKRAGMTEGTRSNLWVQMREAIAVQKPSIVIWENVRGAYSACADSEMGRCPRCMGLGGEHRPFLRALGRVLGDLAALGYDARWGGLPASAIGAPHDRYRVFVVAYANDGRRGESDSNQWRLSVADSGRSAFLDAIEREQSWERQKVGWFAAVAGGSEEVVSNAGGDEPERWGVGGDLGGAEGENEGAGEERQWVWDATRDRGEADADADDAGWLEPRGAESIRPELFAVECSGEDSPWGEYGPAIRRWEALTGRAAPWATAAVAEGAEPSLSARFVEWMMGQPDGHVTDPEIWIGVNPITARNAQIKALGNGVVTQQAIYAIDRLAA